MTYFDTTVDTDFGQLLNRLAYSLHYAPERLLRLTLAELIFNPESGKWSKKEICGHLIDSAVNNLQRFTETLYQESPYRMRPYAQDDLVRINDYQNQPIEDILQLWQGLNRQIHRLAASLNEQQLSLPIIFLDGSEVSLQWLISDYIGHMEHHLRQIFDLEESLKPNPEWQISLLDADKKLQAEYDKAKFITLMQTGSMLIELYRPEKVDLQQPHEQDEIYIVERGCGIFFRGGDRTMFRSGDVLFVPAGMEHRFEQFSADFKTWVIFYGPKGGETNS